ncbi:ras guanine nucleotide exchange factor domain-containing protein [Sporodiniella umbellata]|nr:ras guanine nucleotide exchange factor domain-containing protein [Sporodiniella umbellata]
MNSISPPTSPVISTFTSHFVQALHDYLPSSAPVTDEAVTCLFFKKGSIIEVLNRDHSGWWDGQCGNIRGWFPSNYVGRIGEARRDSVDSEQDNGEFALWQKIRAQEKVKKQKSLSPTISDILARLKQDHLEEEDHLQILVFQLVSCIKSILIEFNIVDKDSPLLRVYPELARQRKTVFYTLNRLVMKCKEPQKYPQALETIAEGLLYDLNGFERILQTLPSLDDFSSSSRSSLNSLSSHPYDSKSQSSLLLSTFRLNTETITHTLLDRQNALQDLIHALLTHLPFFLAYRREKTTELLDITQRAIEAVKSFLSIVEHTCSNFEELDRQLSPTDDSLWVSLVFAKESVYAAITNLVTAIRASTHPQSDPDASESELEHLKTCCHRVIQTTHACVQACRHCLQPPREGVPPLASALIELPTRHPAELHRKIASLKAIGDSPPRLRPRASSVHHHPAQKTQPKRARGLSMTSLRSSLYKKETWEPPPMPSQSSPLNPTPVPQVDPGFLKHPEWTEEDLILNQHGDIKYASIEAIVQHLTFHQKAAVLVPIRLRVYNMIKTWLESYFQYEQDVLIQKDLVLFIETGLTEAMPIPAERMLALVHKIVNSRRPFSQKSTLHSSLVYSQKSLPQTSSIFSNLSIFDDPSIPTPNLNKSTRNLLKKASLQNDYSLLHLVDLDPIELARQITLLQNHLFCQIEPYEIRDQRFKKKKKSANIKAMISKSTQTTNWIQDSILSELDVKKRANVLKYWIKVADACLQLNNYDTLMAIQSALSSTCIIRLKKTWDNVPNKHKSLLKSVLSVLDSSRNYSEYRGRLKVAVAPCLPFLGIYLTDMTFFDDGNPDSCITQSGKKLINMYKFTSVTKIFIEIDQFQKPYHLSKLDEIQAYLLHHLESISLDEEIYREKSYKLEP